MAEFLSYPSWGIVESSSSLQSCPIIFNITKEIKLLTDFLLGSLFVCVVLLEGIPNKFIVHGNLLLVTNGYFEVYVHKSLA